ncbi:MAG: PQQ-dependent sugar dehydrogenase [Gammaproteobacteria bacterium]
MKTIKFLLLLLPMLPGLVFCRPAQTGIGAADLSKIKLPPGFSISLFAADAPQVRSLALGENGVVFAGSREGEVYAFQDSDGDGKAEKRYIIASGLFKPNGVAYRSGALYVAEVNRIIRYDNILQQLAAAPKPRVVYDRLPKERWHGWKYLRFGPDGKLYTAVGAPCNICNPEKDVYASLVRLNADGSGFEIIARGVRNSVGFDWEPQTHALFFTDNGRDNLGDDEPPEELNRWTTIGSHYGYPFCHGGDIVDPEFGAKHDCAEFVPPVWKFKAHMAALGVRFYTGTQFPPSYRQQLFVAEHGSWNRSVPHGYRVVSVRIENGQPVSDQVFAEGWLQPGGRVIGRPVDILVAADGALLVSDDKAGVIYRIAYSGT